MALARMARDMPEFPGALTRYLTNGGQYPWVTHVRTPLGSVRVELASRHDLLTLNEVFFRQDYGSLDRRASVVVDVGANIGIATLFFLTRHPNVRCYAVEPVPRNLDRLRQHVRRFQDRVRVMPEAIADREGHIAFTVESSGRYGHVARSDETNTIVVPARTIETVLRGILIEEQRIDLLKVDTEGSETAIVEAIPPELLQRIRRVLYEDNRGSVTSYPTGAPDG